MNVLKPRILLLDPDRRFAAALRAQLADVFELDHCDQLSDAAVDSETLAVAVVDPVALAAGGGRAVEQLRLILPKTPLIVAAQQLAVTDVVRWMRAGATDCLLKPIDVGRLLAAIRRALPPAANSALDADHLDSHDPSILRLNASANRAAQSDATLLLTGETGTGKSRLARWIHERSPRRDRPFVTLACGCLVPALAGSELFGHVQGAFSDATRDAPGRLSAAEGGTLLLDDVDLASPQLQAQLLRVLQDRTYEPVGSNDTRRADVRILATSNADLPSLVAAGQFRADLFHRLNVIALHLLPLRERGSELTALVEQFLIESAHVNKRPTPSVEASILDALQQYAWPGNVRELQHAIERAVLLADGATVRLEHLPPAIGGSARIAASPMTLGSAIEPSERSIIRAALDRNAWNRQATAAELGIDRTTLYKKMKRLGLSIASRGRAA